MSSPVQKIKEKLSIEDVVSSYIKLDKAGVNLKAKCPFHNEKTPSFFVSPDRCTYYCFGCGASGDIFSFVENFEGLDFKGALKMLAVREAATLRFIDNLSHQREAMEYLKSRGLAEQSVKEFRIGFAKEEWRDLYDYLKKKGFSDSEIEKAGLTKKSEKGSSSGGFYDRFRNRIIFPISDSGGRVIAFSGRIFKDDGKSAKYLNSPETLIFKKSSVLYGLDKAKESIRKNNFSILVEGQMDLVLSHQAMFRNTVATSGTALSDTEVSKENVVSNLGLIRRLSDNLVLAFDSDKAGMTATARAGKIALSLGMDVKVANLPEGSDPADLISRDGAPSWKEAIKNSKHLIEFLLNGALKDAGGDMRKAGRIIKEKILPYVDSLSSAIEKSYFLKKISDLASVPLSALEEDLKKIEKDRMMGEKHGESESGIASPDSGIMRRQDYIIRRLLGVVFWQKSLPEEKTDTDRILLEISEVLGRKPEELLETYGKEKENLIFEAEVFYGSAPFDKDLEEMLLHLQVECLKEKLETKMRELGLVESAGEADKSSEVPTFLFPVF